MSCLRFASVYLPKNLAFLLDKNGLNANSLSEVDPRLKQPTTRRLLIGDSENPRQSTIKHYADFFGVSVGDMLYTDLQRDNAGGTITFDRNVEVSSNAKRMLPVLSWVQAGQWTNTDPVQEHDISEFIPAFGETSDKSFYLKVMGLSNFPEYIEGDYICVDPNHQVSDLQTGDMVVVTCNGEATFKMLIVEANGKRYLKPLNKEWTPQIMELTEDCGLVGLVTGVYRPVRRNRMS